MRASHIVHAAIGAPDPPKQFNGGGCACAVCGTYHDAGVLFKDMFGASFSEYDLLASPQSDSVCVPCAWSFGSKPPQTLRLWTLVHRSDRPMLESNPKSYLQHPALHCGSKADMSEVVATLLEPPRSPWVVCVATSGQKHTLPWATANTGDSWTVRMETEDVSSDARSFGRCMWHVITLMQLGENRECIIAQTPSISAVVKDPAAYRASAGELAGYQRNVVELATVVSSPKEKWDEFREYAYRAWHATGTRDDEECEHDPYPADGLVGTGAHGTGVQRSVRIDAAADGDDVRPSNPRRNPAQRHGGQLGFDFS